MAFSMHTHSGQFCPGHAVDQLEDIIRHAVSVGYKTIGLSEHMPRYEQQDLYPEELDGPFEASLQVLVSRHEAYLVEAQRLQKEYADKIHILIGFEGDFIRQTYQKHIKALAAPPCVDYFIGSLHHVHGIPIDYDASFFSKALAASGGSEERLFEDYYDEQHEMLRMLRPRVVGHFDLIRLKSAEPGRDVREWKGVWGKIKRNLECIYNDGGWLECNTAALRKGLAEPYPCRSIAEEWLNMGGKFTMSDDSHGISQIATNYASGIAYLESLGVKEVWTLQRSPHPGVEGDANAKLEDISIPLIEFKKSLVTG